MDPFFETLRNATTLKKFLDELEKNPKRTLLALGAVLLLTGAGFAVAFRPTSGRPKSLSQIPTLPAEQDKTGQYRRLPQAAQAEQELRSTRQSEKSRTDSVTAELDRRKNNSPVTEREVRLLNESGNVQY